MFFLFSSFGSGSFVLRRWFDGASVGYFSVEGGAAFYEGKGEWVSTKFKNLWWFCARFVIFLYLCKNI